MAFGETTVIKPSSFRILDSLFEIKYQNEKREIRDKELENKIYEWKKKRQEMMDEHEKFLLGDIQKLKAQGTVERIKKGETNVV